MGDVEQIAGGHYRSRSATYVHPGVICRSTTGTGTSARMALMHHEGRMQPGDTLETVSLRGSSFLGTFTRVAQAGGYDVVENTITGKAYVIARSQIVVNPADELVDSSQLRGILTCTQSAD
jgi:proline racemase